MKQWISNQQIAEILHKIGVLVKVSDHPEYAEYYTEAAERLCDHKAYVDGISEPFTETLMEKGNQQKYAKTPQQQGSLFHHGWSIVK